MNSSIVLVGCGNMGGAMLSGWLHHDLIAPQDVTIIDPTAKALPEKVACFSEAPSDLEPPDILVLAVKPQKLAEAAPALEALAGSRTLVLSVLAAIDFATLRQYFPSARAIVRAVPNTPAAIGEGITALAADTAGSEIRNHITRLFQPLGLVEWLENERALDAATPVSGCGPAFLFRYAEAFAAAASQRGLEQSEALRLIAQTMVGAGKLLLRADGTPAEMIARVASPGGVTLAGLAVLDSDQALSKLIESTFEAAARRNAEMSDQFGHV